MCNLKDRTCASKVCADAGDQGRRVQSQGEGEDVQAQGEDVQVQVKTCKLTGQVSGVYLELVVDDDDGVLVVIDDGRVFIVAFLIVTFLDLCLFPLCPDSPCSGRLVRPVLRPFS